MHTKERILKVTELAAKVGRSLRRQKQTAIALVVVAPLLTGMGYEVFALNAVGLGIGALFIRGQLLRRKQERAHRLWLTRRAEREEDEHQRWLQCREREAGQGAR